jgi:hypothetical protein
MTSKRKSEKSKGEAKNDECCYLCLSKDYLTRDHVPPQNLFIPPLPSNLITVPCCKDCNASFQLDDEAFRAFASAYIAKSQVGRWIWDNKVVGSTFKRSPKFQQSLAKSLIKVPIRTPLGEIEMNAITFPQERANRYLIRLTKGLLHKFYPNIDYRDAQFIVIQVSITQELINWLYKTITYDERGDGVIRFWRWIARDSKATGLWVYVFYDGLCFQVTHTTET